MSEPAGGSPGLANVWQQIDQIEAEHDELSTYTTAQQFWQNYGSQLDQTGAQIGKTVGNLSSVNQQGQPGSASAALSALQQVMSQGQQSVQSQRAEVNTLMPLWQNLIGQLGVSHGVAMNAAHELASTTIAGGTPGTGPIPMAMGQQSPAQITAIISEVNDAWQKLQASFESLGAALNGIQDGQWQGPGAAANASPAAKGGGGAAGAQKTAGGQSATGGAGNTGSSTGDSATGDSATGDGGSASSTTDPSAGLGDDSSLAGGADSGNPPPSTDPTLAGSPTATLPTSTSLPTNSLSGLGNTGPGSTSNSGGLGSSNFSSFTPMPLPTLSTTKPPSTTQQTPLSMDENAGPDSAAAAQAGEAAATEATAGGGGVYPPMMPPMFGGAGGHSGVQAGEADGTGGPPIRWRGRDSTRAGLVPELSGRGGQDGDPDDPTRYAQGGEVLDEELWQVSSTSSPVVPPGLDSRRPGRMRTG